MAKRHMQGGHDGSTAIHSASEMAFDGFEYKLSEAGLAFLAEIFNANKALPNGGGEWERVGPVVDLADLPSFADRKRRRSVSEIMSYLFRAGYLGCEEMDDDGADTMRGDYVVTGVLLGDKAYDALIEAGVVERGAGYETGKGFD